VHPDAEQCAGAERREVDLDTTRLAVVLVDAGAIVESSGERAVALAGTGWVIRIEQPPPGPEVEDEDDFATSRRRSGPGRALPKAGVAAHEPVEGAGCGLV